MKILLPLLLGLLFFSAQAQDYSNEQEHIKLIYTTALVENQGYEWLRQLTEIGPRLTGSPEADQAVRHFQKVADSLGFHTELQPVKVPRWLRGPKEIAYYTSNGKKHPLNSCALGGSIGTGEDGLKGELVELHSFEQLDSLEDELQGKIAFFNIPMDPAYINTFFAYSNAAKQRWIGAVEASKKGAVGVVIRSLSNTINEYPHTGSMTYKGAETKIPAMAISTADTERLSKALAENPNLEFFMKMGCEWRDSVTSYNLIADLPGKEKPDEIILIGGHIDSWDLGTGAHDDGAGSMHALESAWLLQKLGMLPKRTLRVVFFMNEEFGLSGAKEYAKQAKLQEVNHVLAIESDAGGFVPRGISMVAPDSVINQIKELRSLLEPYGVHRFSQTGAGADIVPLKKDGVVLMGLRPDSQRYFEIHHAATDVLEAVNPRELELGSATLAAVIYLLDKYEILAR